MQVPSTVVAVFRDPQCDTITEESLALTTDSELKDQGELLLPDGLIRPHVSLLTLDEKLRKNACCEPQFSIPGDLE